MDILFARALALKARVLLREAMQTRAMWLAFLHLKLSVSIAVLAPVRDLLVKFAGQKKLKLKISLCETSDHHLLA